MGNRDFFHTGLNVGRSDIQSVISGLGPSTKRYVKKDGNDALDGLSWDRAYATIAKAITESNDSINWSASPWAPNWEINIAPGSYAESLTALPYGSSLIGWGDAFDADGEKGVRIKPASGGAIACTSIINTMMYNLNIQVADASDILLATNFNNNQVIHCSFQGPPEATTATRGMNLTDAVAI